MFGYEDAIQYLLEFENLEECNNGRYWIGLDKGNFGQYVHLYLGWYMRVVIRELKVVVQDIASG